MKILQARSHTAVVSFGHADFLASNACGIEFGSTERLPRSRATKDEDFRICVGMVERR